MTKNPTNSIASLFTIAFSTRKLSLLTFIAPFLAAPAFATPHLDIKSHTTSGNTVTLNVNVLDDDNIPIEGLNATDFRLQATKLDAPSQTAPTSSLTLVPPSNRARLDPAETVILLDMSGSMDVKDSSGVRKIDGAIAAIRGFLTSARQNRLPGKLAIIPFATGNSSCAFRVTPYTLNTDFHDINDTRIDSAIDWYAQKKPCGSTNLYDPVAEAVRFLGDRAKQLSQDPNTTTFPPRSTVILLSDGFHAVDRTSEPDAFNKLTTVLKSYPHVKVHTLGYGESLRELQKRAKNCDMTEEELNSAEAVNTIQNCKLEAKDGGIVLYIVDQPRLSQIASLTSGISRFPKSAAAAVSDLETFFKSLRSYQLKYQQLDAKPADRYLVNVSAIVQSNAKNITASPLEIRIDNLGAHALPLFPDRALILAGSILGLGVTTLAFYQWSRKLKQQSYRS